MIPLALCNVDEIDSEALVVYAWICQSSDYSVRDISILSGINLQKVSSSVKRLENRRLIIVDRKTGSIKMAPASIPASIVERAQQRLDLVENKRAIKQLNQQFKTGVAK